MERAVLHHFGSIVQSVVPLRVKQPGFRSHHAVQATHAMSAMHAMYGMHATQAMMAVQAMPFHGRACMPRTPCMPYSHARMHPCTHTCMHA